jgi:chaperonin GroEL
MDARDARRTWARSKSFGFDLTKVVRTAIESASSVAALLITTEAMIAELPKKNAPAAGMLPGGGMGGMDF